MPNYTHAGTRFTACNKGCADAFKNDRRAGLNYGLQSNGRGGFYLHREQWSICERACAYCGAAQVLEVRKLKGETNGTV